MRHTIRGFALALVVVALAVAGDEGPALEGPARLAQEIDKLCRSENAKDIAWGAYLAATHGPAPNSKDRDAWIAPLEAALTKYATSARGRDLLLSRAILDAFIQRAARPSVETLARCIRWHAPEVIVLSAQDPERYEAVLRAMQSPNMADTAWMAVANLLRARKTPGAVFLVLRGARTNLDVSVLVERNSAIGIGGGSGNAPRQASTVDDPQLAVPPGWPPAVHYRLSDYVWRGWTVVAPGSHPVLFQRHESRTRQGARARLRASITRNAFRFHVLADCLGWPFHELRVGQSAHEVIYWEGEEEFVKEVAEERFYLRLFWDGEIRSLMDDGFLTKQEASQLELDVVIKSTWMALGGKRALPEVPEGVLEQEKERRQRKRDLTK
ncbi:MAG: hypothetical protein QNJ90_14080 [Planctomycetota bacterium]|nr:hypothetical protein [Planctomycetota bacterium]